MMFTTDWIVMLIEFIYNFIVAVC